MFIISFKRLSIVFLIFFILLFSIATVSADDNVASGNDNTTIYVANDDTAIPNNVSFAYSNIMDAVDNANDNSTIVICDGVYSGFYNTGLTIAKNLTIKSLSNNVVIDGEGKNQFFNVQSGSSLILEDLNFINGFSDVYSNQEGIFENYGSLIIKNVNINNMDAFMGTIFNHAELTIFDSNFSKCKASAWAQSIVNVGNCSIFNSIILKDTNSKIDVCVYNCGNIIINGSNINSINSNQAYGNYNISAIIINSKIRTAVFENTTADIKNCEFLENAVFKYSNVNLNNVTVKGSQYSLSYSLSSFGSNITAISSVFNNGINAPDSKLNITYSIILGEIVGGGFGTEVYAPYNWWGDNKGPKTQYVRLNAANWVLMLFEASQSPIEVSTNATFTVSLNKILSNNRIYELPNETLLPKRLVYLESESGYFTPSSGYVDGVFTAHLINNVEDSLVYANIDSQKSRLVIGTGSSDYELYVSPSLGNNAYADGSYDNPYQTLEFAISKALNGNKIYLLDGVYTYAYNSELYITKNITIVGLGNVLLKRDDNRNIFSVAKTGNLLIKNVNFTILSDAYSNPLFLVYGGNLTIENASFHNIKASSIIDSQSGSIIHIDSCNFSNNKASVAEGSGLVYVNNSIFERNVKFYENTIYYDYNYLFTSSGLLEVYNSIFRKNELGIVNLHPTIQYSSSMLKVSLIQSGQPQYALFKNSTFENNEFKELLYPYVAFKMYDSYNTLYGFIDNCSFIKNIGLKINLNSINSSVFMENTNTLINAITVNNSYFEKNSNLVKSGSSYTGNGILNAQNITNSTFILNKAAYGGALYNPKIVHYCVFVNNTAQYEGNDIFSYSGDVDYSSNWWGNNQKPDSNKIYIFLGTLRLDNWIIMTLKNDNGKINASLNTLIDDNEITTPLNYIINQRTVYFTSDEGVVIPNTTKLNQNSAIAEINYSGSGNFKVYSKIDNQLLDTFVHNNSTGILMDDVSFYGRYNKYYFTLININGQKISNQTLIAEVIYSNGKKESMTVKTDEKGLAHINFEYPVGNYTLNVFYEGNGYFEKSNNSAKVSVLIADTVLTTYNYTFYGKNNNFYAVLNDFNKKAIENKTILFKITNSKGESRLFNTTTNSYGRADLYLTLDVGKYTIQSTFKSDGWYSDSSAFSIVDIRPVNSTINVPNVTLYGVGNLYNITLKNQFGTLISGENINVIISQGELSDKFVLTTNSKGIAQLAINYLPGTYNIKATYDGDYIYGSAYGEAVINVEQVLTKISSFYHVEIPLNGFYIAVLTDMYGNRIFNESVSLNIYKGSLIKSYVTKTSGIGEAVFKIDLDEGKYLATIDYEGNDWYGSSTGAATIIVNNQTVLYNVELNASDLVQYYGEDKFFVISLNDPNAFSQYGKTIHVTISSDTVLQTYDLITDAFGQARMQIKLNPGIYNITYSYSNSYYNIYGKCSNSIFVYKMPSSIRASNVIVKKGEERALEIYLTNINNNPIRNMRVNVELNGNKYNITTNNDGFARLPINLDVGNYVATFSFKNENYLSSAGSARILVTDLNKTSTYLKGNDINGFEDQQINYFVSLSDELNGGIAGSVVSLDIYDIDGNFVTNLSNTTDSNGSAEFNFMLSYGKYVLNVNYQGSSKYLGSNTFNYLNVDVSSNLTKTILSGKLSYKNKYILVLIDENAVKLSNREVEVKINNKTFFLLTNQNGEASFDLGFNAGYYNISVKYFGDASYCKASFSDYVILSGNSNYLFADDLVKYYRNGTQFYAQLLDSFGNPLVGYDILFNIGGVNITNKTDINGWATLYIGHSPGVYNVSCSYENTTTNAKITVLSTIIANDLVKEFKNASKFVAKVIDGKGNPIINKNVTILYDNEFYVRVSDGEGFVHMDIDSNPGNYTITVQNPYDGLKETYNICVLPSTNLINTKIIGYLTDEGYELKLVDIENKSLSNARLSIRINTNDYSLRTDRNGQVLIKINKTGIYNIKTSFAGDGLYGASSFEYLLIISANKNKLVASDVVKYYRNATQFYAQLLDESSNPLSNKKINLAISGVNYTRQTNASGWVKLNINLVPGVYDIYCAYWGSSDDEDAFALAKITVLPTVIANDLVKYYRNDSQFYAKLLDGLGNPLANVNVTMNINGVFYTRMTNGEGIVRLNINLDPGKYILTLTNPNDGLSQSSIITVLSTIIANDLVKYYRNDSQFYAKLLDGLGNPLANVNVTMNINGVFYTRMTNGEGIVRLNINLDPGKYILTLTNQFGFSSSYNIVVLPTLSAKDLYMNYKDGSQFKVNLLDGRGKPYSNQKVVFNINGVFYDRFTDGNGVARLNINLMPGKYIISSSYGGLTISNHVVVNSF